MPNGHKERGIDHICCDFCKGLYKYKVIFHATLKEVFVDFPKTITNTLKDKLTKDIAQHEFYRVMDSMASGKTPGHDGMPIELIGKLWLALGNDLCMMIKRNIDLGTFHARVTKGVRSLIPKEGEGNNLNN